MTSISENAFPGMDSRGIEDRPNAVNDFSNLTDNYDPDKLNEEEDEDDVAAEGSNVDEPDLDEDEMSRIFPGQNDILPDPDEVDGTADFDEEIDPSDIDIPEEDNDLE